MPIIGYGDIGSILNDREGALFFASGVSDSSCTDKHKFQREIDLLIKQDRNLCCFYFSSIFSETKDTPYFRHKRNMEEQVKKHFRNYNIIRLGNILWGSNPKTFINYIRHRKENGWPVDIKNEYRYVITREQLLLMTDWLPLDRQNCISIFGRMAKVKDLIK